MLKESLFYGKILLFGEYGIIQDSMGLSIPYNSYMGTLTFDKGEKSEESNSHLKAYSKYLKKLVDTKALKIEFRIDTFVDDIENGLSFDSTIPSGFGVGSSGALVAAIYHKYAAKRVEFKNKPRGKEIATLKDVFAQMESYFHGKSSGLDPLICYLNLPVLVKSKTSLDTVGLPETNKEGKGAIFLINSGMPGQTEPMVNIFMEKMKQEGFRNMLRKEFKKYNDLCIEAFLNKNTKPLFQNIKQLSKLLFQNFKPMIPASIQALWQEGIDNNEYYLKLCGSGGGGYFLGFTEDYELVKKKLKLFKPELVHSF